MTDEPAADASSRETTTSWRELAVARSLDPARVRAEKRVQRFLDAALELMMNSSGKEFTVQDVVERSGQSLRSFYLYFAGKYELLLALFEESVRSTAAHLEQVVADDDEPLARLRRFTVEYYRLCQPSPKARSAAKAPGPAMAEFAQQLLTQHPKEASRAFVPLVEILEQLLDDAAAAGTIRSGLSHRRLAGIMLQSVMFNLFAATISGSPAGEDDGARADEYWDLVLEGIAP
ncbi:MAG TPA: TetR/AcrR family transcriptional regulator [Acidimicrobiales bacterium]|jgi:AcrR family transcriptional regulator|nr:TetR/AcrR family transcriptional regulator [Acidimicrobiales bacterium]